MCKVRVAPGQRSLVSDSPFVQHEPFWSGEAVILGVLPQHLYCSYKMSSRNIRKLTEKIRLASLDQKSETENPEAEDFQPHYANTSKSAYAGLVVSSGGEESGKDESDDDTASSVAMPKKKNKNNRKKKNKNKRRSCSEDDVAKVVAEVNEILGEPELPASEAGMASQPPISCTLLKIDYKHLNMNNELTRLFGPDENENLRQRRQRNNTRMLRRQIVMTNDTYQFSVKGLSMTCLEIRDGVKYFKFDHSLEYQKNMHALVQAMKIHHDNFIREQQWSYDVHPSTTIEALIKNLDLYFNLDESSIGITSLEHAIFFMQSVFDSAFNYIDGKTRLEYRHVENRAFHIVLLKYLHTLTNKACHRTALEIAKLMLNLDPSDPLGVIFIIDTLAIRAREFKWLIDIDDHWCDERDGAKLFHTRYSVCLAKYQLYLKSRRKEDLEEASTRLKSTVLAYPTVAVQLMKLCKQEKSEVINHEMFSTIPEKSTSEDFKNLMLLYGTFIWPKWREENIIDWVNTICLDLIKRYKSDKNLRDYVQSMAIERSRLFKKYPLEIKRHLSIIGPMSNLLVEGAVPVVPKTVSFNPYPTTGTMVDVHQYYKDWGSTITEEVQLLRSFLLSLVPEGLPENRGGIEEELENEDRGSNYTVSSDEDPSEDEEKLIDISDTLDLCHLRNVSDELPDPVLLERADSPETPLVTPVRTDNPPALQFRGAPMVARLNYRYDASRRLFGFSHN